MTCANCGMQIPVIGNVCPYCGANRPAASPEATVTFVIMLIIAFLFAAWFIYIK